MNKLASELLSVQGPLPARSKNAKQPQKPSCCL